MKTTIAVLMMLVLTFAFGLAYADILTAAEPMSGKMGETSLYNGITYFDTGPAVDCSSRSGVGAGGAVSPELSNGVTLIELGMPGSGARGICAGSTGEETHWINNGVTVFEAVR